MGIRVKGELVNQDMSRWYSVKNSIAEVELNVSDEDIREALFELIKSDLSAMIYEVFVHSRAKEILGEDYLNAMSNSYSYKTLQTVIETISKLLNPETEKEEKDEHITTLEEKPDIDFEIKIDIIKSMANAGAHTTAIVKLAELVRDHIEGKR